MRCCSSILWLVLAASGCHEREHASATVEPTPATSAPTPSPGPERPEQIAELEKSATQSMRDGDYAQSARAWKQVIELHVQQGTSEGSSAAGALAHLADALMLLGDADGAHVNAEQADALFLRIGGELEDGRALAQFVLGVAALERGAIEEARPHFETQLSILTSAHGADSVQAASGYTRMGKFLHQSGDAQLALEYFTKALAIKEREHGPSSRQLTSALNNIGAVLMDLEAYAEAVDVLRRCLEIRSRVDGAEHPATAQVHHNLGMALRRAGQFDEAIYELEQALRIREASLGVEHRYTKSTRGALDEATRLRNVPAGTARDLP